MNGFVTRSIFYLERYRDLARKVAALDLDGQAQVARGRPILGIIGDQKATGQPADAAPNQTPRSPSNTSDFSTSSQMTTDSDQAQPPPPPAPPRSRSHRAMRNLQQELRRSRRASSSTISDTKAQEHMLRWTYARAGPRRWDLLGAAFPAADRRRANRGRYDDISATTGQPQCWNTPPPLPKILDPYLAPLKLKEMKTPPRLSPKSLSRRRLKNQEWKERARVLKRIELPMDLLVAAVSSGGRGGGDRGGVNKDGEENGKAAATTKTTTTTTTRAQRRWQVLGKRLTDSLERMSAPSTADEHCAVPRRLQQEHRVEGVSVALATLKGDGDDVGHVSRRWRRLYGRLRRQTGVLSSSN